MKTLRFKKSAIAAAVGIAGMFVSVRESRIDAELRDEDC